MIVHDLNLGGNEPEFSEKLINLTELIDTDDESVLEDYITEDYVEQINVSESLDGLEFFKEHIKNNRTQGFTKQCKFLNNPANHVRNTITTLYPLIEENAFDDHFDEQFILQSKIITGHLHTSMKGKSRSDGAVFIFVYTLQEQRYLGILKMDPNLGIQVNENLTLTVRKKMLPSVKEKLHKSAFIKFSERFDDDLKTDLFILDRQQTRDEPAKYFMLDFLIAREKANADNLTPELLKNIKNEICLYIDTDDKKSSFVSRLTKRFSSNEEFNLEQHILPLLEGLLPNDFPIEQSLKAIKDKTLVKYPDAVFSFIPNPEKVKDLEFKNEDKSITIKISNNISEELYTHQVDEQENIIFTFKKELNVKPMI
ncbi:hypothetical protein SporoS204_01555 [Sporosarcina ureae]|uniref:Nucleoid-associated protein n=2 Tax=Sporosarcina ureae TaxID=1571 RepID=A0ABM6JS72_SPOUR|nr:hypothetical protein SporoS204_01555 [Sporosarcina ureae]